MSVLPGFIERPARVLIVDDERQNRQLLEVMLKPEGFDLVVMGSGEEALAEVKRQPPDLILLDVMMPGMDGYQVVTRIKGNPATKNIPVIMLTALDDSNSRIHGLSAGAEDFLSKPINRVELTARVRNLLRLKAHSDDQESYSQLLEGEVGSRRADLVASERLYRSTFDATPVGILHVSLDGRWLLANNYLCELLGYPCEELQLTHVQQQVVVYESPEEAEFVRRMVAGELERHVLEDKRYRRQDGSVVVARVIMSLHRDIDGRVEHLIYVIEDVTDRRTLEAQVRQAGKMDAIGRLASGVAHDFNNLLTVILGFAEIIAEDARTKEEFGQEIGEIIGAAQRASGLTRQLLAFGRQQVLNAQILDVNALVKEMGGMLGRLMGERVELQLSLAPDLQPALADHGQIEQVVMNLVVNARDAMPQGGKVVIETRNVSLENSSFHPETIMTGEYVMLAVSDTGEGMTREVRDRLFEPFFTTKEAGMGTGLGLSTSYGIVKQSNGYIWVYSEPGMGTTFKVYFPRATEGALPVPRRNTPAAVPAIATETILLVEDEPNVRRLTRRILDNAGYRVLEAQDVVDAEKLFAHYSDSVDLMVTDVVMPGMNGPTLYARLRKLVPTLRVLYTSGYTDHFSAHLMGIDRGLPFVQKPFTAAELESQVRAALRRTPD